MKHLILGFLLFSAMQTNSYAQYRDYTGAGSTVANTATAISTTPKLHSRRTNKEAQPTNSVTVMPIEGVTIYPALSFQAGKPQATIEESVAVSGAKVGDKVELFVPRNAALPGLNWVAWVSRDNVVKVRYTNTTAATQSIPALEVFKIHVQHN